MPPQPPKPRFIIKVRDPTENGLHAFGRDMFTCRVVVVNNNQKTYLWRSNESGLPRTLKIRAFFQDRQRSEIILKVLATVESWHKNCGFRNTAKS